MMGNNVKFVDTANGGWYCRVCERYIHPDMIHQHNDHNHKKGKFKGPDYPHPTTSSDQEMTYYPEEFR